VECHHAFTRKDLGFDARMLIFKVELDGLFARSDLRQGDAAIGVNWTTRGCAACIRPEFGIHEEPDPSASSTYAQALKPTACMLSDCLLER
jgi:hypothetical protein